MTVLVILIPVFPLSLLIKLWKTDYLRNDKYVSDLNSCMNLRGLYFYLFLSFSFSWRRCECKKDSELGIHFWTFSSVSQLCPTLCDPMNCSTPGLPVHHQLPEITQTYVHRVSDAIEPSHPLLSPSPPVPN